MARVKRAQVTKSESPVTKQATSTSAEKTNGNGNAQGSRDLEPVIRARAYELYEKRGRQDGYAHEDWLQAEAEVRSQFSRTV